MISIAYNLDIKKSKAERPWIFYVDKVFLEALRSHLREEEHILDGRGVGHEHCQTVDSHSES